MQLRDILAVPTLVTKRGRFKFKHKQIIDQIYTASNKPRDEVVDTLYAISGYADLLEAGDKFICDQVTSFASRRKGHADFETSDLENFMYRYRAVLYDALGISYVKNRHDGHMFIKDEQ